MEVSLKWLVGVILIGICANVAAVIHGEDAQSSEFPYVVAIRTRWQNENGTLGGRTCTGSIISDEWILTAAHCFANGTEVRGNVTAGIHLWWLNALLQLSTPDPIEIERIVMHESYRPNHVEHDIALVKVAKKFVWSSELQPVALARSDPVPPGAAILGQMAGWASTKDSMPHDVLQTANVTLFAYAMCHNELIAAWTAAGSFIKCARGHSASPCNGDSGSPLVVDGVQVGVVVFASGCGECPYEVGYVPVPEYIEWIGQHCENCIPEHNRQKEPQPVVLSPNPSMWNSSAYRVGVLDSTFETVCAGTVIGDRWVLTTATCVRRHEVAFISPWGFYGGGHVKVNRTIVPNEYQLGKPLHDIALLELQISEKSWVARIQKVRLDPDFVQPRSTANHIGWTYYMNSGDSEPAPGSDTLVHVVFDEVCQKYYAEEAEFDDSSMFCGIEFMRQGVYEAVSSEGTSVIKNGVIVGLKLGSGVSESYRTNTYAKILPNDVPLRFTRITRRYIKWIDGHCNCLEYLRPGPSNFWGFNDYTWNIFQILLYVHAWKNRVDLLKDFRSNVRIVVGAMGSVVAFAFRWVVAMGKWAWSKGRRG